MRPLLVSWLLLLASAWAPALGADYYVSPQGRNSNAGTQSAPWRTVQKAVNALVAGDTLWIGAGVYREKVTLASSGSAEGGWISLKALPGTRPVLDAAGLKPGLSESGVILIRDRDYIRVEGLTLRGFSTGRADLAPAGIFVTGGCDHVELRGNRVHHITTRATKGNAFGIAVYGSSAEKPISSLVLDENEVDHCLLGASESMSINGNVTGFEVTNNRVHDNNNIGIVFIGFEGTCPDASLDQARDGVCRGNLVFNIKSYGNPAYGKHFEAGGLYVDGGTRILIERNVAHHCDIGVELASEHAGRSTSAITLRDNLIYLNRIGGLFLGGYDAQRGKTENCEIHHNTFYHNDTRSDGNGEVYLQHFVSGCLITQNIVATGAQGLFLGSPYQDSSANVLDYNLYFATVDGAWQWQGNSFSTWAEYRAASGQDGHSLLGEPMWADAAQGDFHLTAGSPARDTGDPAFAPGNGEVDLDGAPRVQGGRVDLGADEF